MARQLAVYVLETNKKNVDLPAGSEWVRVEIPLSELGSPAQIANLHIQNRTNDPQTMFYVDDITLEGSSGKVAYIYTDSLLENVGIWNGTINFASTSQVHSGVYAISVEITGSWGGFHLRRRQAPFSTVGFDRIAFYVHPNGNAHTLLIQTQNDAGQNSTQYSFVVPSGNDWTLIEIPLSSLGNPTDISRITIQDGTGSTQPLFYIDDIVLLGP